MRQSSGEESGGAIHCEGGVNESDDECECTKRIQNHRSLHSGASEMSLTMDVKEILTPKATPLSTLASTFFEVGSYRFTEPAQLHHVMPSPENAR